MAFIKLLPSVRRNISDVYLGDKIRVAFPMLESSKGVRTQQVSICIGKDACKKYGFKKGDRLALLVDEVNPFIWQLVPDPDGWKLSQLGTNLKLEFRWDRPVPKGSSKILKFVNEALVDGKLQITFPKVTEEIENES